MLIRSTTVEAKSPAWARKVLGENETEIYRAEAKNTVELINHPIVAAR